MTNGDDGAGTARDVTRKSVPAAYRIDTATRRLARSPRSPAPALILLCFWRCRLCRPQLDSGSDLHVLHAGAGAMLEPAGGLCRPGLGRPAGLCRARRLPAVCADAPWPGSIRCVAIPIAGVVSRLFALPTALIVFRLRGAYFAIGTWVVAEVYRLVFAQFKQLGGGTGTSLRAHGHQSAVVGIERVKTLVRRAHAGGARHHHLLGRARAGGRHASPRLSHPALAPRAGAGGDPRPAKAPPRASASTSFASSSAVYVATRAS